jgi:hypothetical protein
MSFAPELEYKAKDETANRESKDYVKFTPDYRVTLRILDENAKVVYKHFVQEANNGRGNSVVCPNIASDIRVCPIELSKADLPKDDPERKATYARRRYITNVLDRTPYTTCKACNAFTPGTNCVACKASLKGHDFQPLNKVKILEGGPRLFVEQLNSIDKMQKEDLGKDITEYDITFTTTGSGRDKKIAALPREPQALDEAWLADENGEPQKKYSLDDLSEPTAINVIKMMLLGLSNEEIGKVQSGEKELPF